MPHDKRAKVKFKTLSCGFESMESHNRDDTVETDKFYFLFTLFLRKNNYLLWHICTRTRNSTLHIFHVFTIYSHKKKSKVLRPVISQANYCVLLDPVHSLGTCVARFIILKRCECNEYCHNRLEIIVKIFGPVCSYFRLK